MSRKSRRHDPPEPAREPFDGEELVDERVTVHHLTGELHDMLAALASSCAFLARGPVPAALLDPESDEFQELAAEMSASVTDADTALDTEEVDELDEDDALERENAALDAEIDELRDVFDRITIRTRELARALIARVLDRDIHPVEQYYVPGASHHEDEVEGATLDEFDPSPLLPLAHPALQPSRTELKAAFEDAEFLLREVGLEVFDVSLGLEAVGDGTYELIAVAVPPESACVELLEFVFNRAEGLAREVNPVLATERDASSFEFSRWSVAPAPGRAASDVASFARYVREQEYSLVDRATITLGTSVMQKLADDQLIGELWPPRQQRMAVALTTSVVGVFECVALDGNRATLKSVRDGSTYLVHEHTEPIEYSIGWVAAGRLVPFDGDLYLRSPGMVFAQPRGVDLARAAANDVGRLEGTLPPALALEAFISTAMMGVNVPRAMKPLRSKADARAALAELELILADERPKFDATLTEFFAAIVDQASAGSAGDRRSRTGGKRKPHGRSKRRR
jgi:hypothetical protein